MKKNIFKLGAILLASFLLSLSMKLIVQPNEFLAGGVSGITILISRFTAIKLNKAELESLLYSIIYVTLNIPILIFGYKKIGKQFICYSVINIALFSFFVSVIPSSWHYKFQLNTIDYLTSAIVAGIIAGFSSVISFVNGFSNGGTDVISMYLSRAKGKGIGNYGFAINIFVLITGGLMFKNYSALIYTVIYFFTITLVVNNLYLGHKKTLIEIVTSNYGKLVDRLMLESHHGCTILDAVGAYSQKEKKLLRIVVSSNQIRRVCEIIKDIDSSSFTTLIEVKQVNGRFYIPPIK